MQVRLSIRHKRHNLNAASLVKHADLVIFVTTLALRNRRMTTSILAAAGMQ